MVRRRRKKEPVEEPKKGLNLDNNTKLIVGALAAILLILGSVTVANMGCGDDNVIAEANSDRMMRLYNCYNLYAESHDFQGPKSEAKLKEFLLNNKGIQPRLERMGVTPDTIVEMFVSERDNEKFKVRWGQPNSGMENDPIVFEAVGVNDRRLVAFSVPREVGPSEYEGLMTGKIDSTMSRKDKMTASGPMTGE